jgi:uncharacterized membrane protein YfcA
MAGQAALDGHGSAAVPISDPWFYLAALPAVLIAGISKGGFGGGIALVAVPLMALVIPPAQAAAIMLPILILMDAIGVIAYRRLFDVPALRVMLPGATLGIALGGVAFDVLSTAALRLIIGVIALVFVASYAFGGGQRAPARQPSAWLGALCGAMSGFTSTLAHAGSPPAQIYLLPLRLDKTVFVATSVMFFAAVNLIKLVPYALIGQFSATNLLTALILAPLATLGMVLGIRLHGLIDPATFYRLCYVFVALTGLKLIWDGLT